jgi:pectate lyase
MPVSKYNSAFGGKKGSASKALASMRKTYGGDKATSVFYATVNKRKKRKPRVVG